MSRVCICAIICLFIVSGCCGTRPLLKAAEPGAGAGEPTGRPYVGVYYYPWYSSVNLNPSSHHGWRENVPRVNLEPPQLPKAGMYSSNDPAAIGEHIAQSLRGGIDFWAVSWGGPDHESDRNLRNAILKHPDAGKLRYAILYESVGRFGSFDRPNYDKWATDLAYMKAHYFDRPEYLRINRRPVLFMYLTRKYFRNRGEEALKLLREEYPEVFLAGDEVFGSGYKREWARSFDAITAYDVYGQSTKRFGGTHQAIEELAKNYAHARTEGQSVGAGFIPVVAPGYNDVMVRPGNAQRARYFADDPDSKEGDVFREMIRKAALPNLDPNVNNMMLVTSFNEWYEDTQIEATMGAGPATTRDNSPSGTAITAGLRYVDYGYLYLDILREETGSGVVKPQNALGRTFIHIIRSVDLQTVAECYDKGLLRYFFDHGDTVEQDDGLTCVVLGKAYPLIGLIREYVPRIPNHEVQLAAAMNHFTEDNSPKQVSLTMWMGGNPRQPAPTPLIPDPDPEEWMSPMEYAIICDSIETLRVMKPSVGQGDLDDMLSKVLPLRMEDFEMAAYLFKLGAYINNKANGGSSLFDSLLACRSFRYVWRSDYSDICHAEQ